MASAFERQFTCKRCGEPASVEELTKGITVVECETCEIGEIWGTDTSVFAPLDHFAFITPEARC